MLVSEFARRMSGTVSTHHLTAALDRRQPGVVRHASSTVSIDDAEQAVFDLARAGVIDMGHARQQVASLRRKRCNAAYLQFAGR